MRNATLRSVTASKLINLTGGKGMKIGKLMALLALSGGVALSATSAMAQAGGGNGNGGSGGGNAHGAATAGPTAGGDNTSAPNSSRKGFHFKHKKKVKPADAAQ
jgi:hypothetical protein